MMMTNEAEPITILMADDDVDDQLLAKQALAENRVRNRLLFVNDGEELLDYLNRRGDFTNAADAPMPDLILLDLNMPRMDGREALGVIKSDENLRRIPVIILTTSDAEEDILRTYNLGANSFITKPVTFQGLVEVMKELSTYWCEFVKLPPQIS